MSRIATNVSNLVAQHTLQKTSTNLDLRLQRLSTGLRINRGADDPAGLIVSERLRSEISAINQGVDNAERASGVIATAEGALVEVSDLLSSIKALVVEAANTGAVSAEERAANQLQIDSAIDAITRISNTTSFAGLKLLDGSLDYLTSGLNTADIAQSRIRSVNFGTRTNVPVDVQVIGSAQTAGIYLSTSTFLALGRLPSAVTLEIQGPEGVQVLDFASGLAVSAVINAVNAVSDNTGIVAAFADTTPIIDPLGGIVFRSQTYGSEAFVSISRIGGPIASSIRTYAIANNGPVPAPGSGFPGAGTIVSASRDQGKDVQAIVNGAVANGRGLEVSVRVNSLELELVLQEAFATAPPPGTVSSFRITGGGALYQLGPRVISAQQTNIGIQSLADSRLGGTLINVGTGVELQYLNSIKSGGDNELAARNFIAASKILDSAIDEVAVLRGKLGAFERNTLQTNVRSLQSAVENVSAATSQIRDADFASETSELTRAQILNQAGIVVLQQTNTQAQSVLQLLAR